MDLNYTPCRVVHCYKYENNKAYIMGFEGIIRLNETASIVWAMSNGKNNIKDILENMHQKFSSVSEEELLSDIEYIIDALSEKGMIIKDWDPLLKDNVSQKENYRWNK